MLRCILAAAVSAALASAALAAPAPPTEMMKVGKPDLKSAGPLAIGPNGVLFVGDSMGAAVFAIKLDASSTKPGPINVEGVNKKIAAAIGASAGQVLINDMAATPNRVFLSVSRGRGPSAMPVIVSVDTTGKISVLSLEKVRYAKAMLPNAPANKTVGKGRRRSNLRLSSITDLHYSHGKVIVAGLSNEEFASKLRVIPFPFKTSAKGASIEIYHGSHGRFETRSPVRTFVPINVGGKPHVVAAYTCTPLVKFPVADLESKVKLKGTTVAELGNHNVPLDIIAYKKDGKQYLLMANMQRGVMKIPTRGIDKIEGITSRIKDKAGLKYQTIESLQGVVHLAKLNKKQAVLLVKNEGSFNLKTIDLP
jgi:hypothetical protein